MTRKTKSNIPASILGRLLVLSKKTGDDYQTILHDLRSGVAKDGTWPPGGPWR